VEKIKTQILRAITVFRKSCHLWNDVEKYCRAEQTTDDNMGHAHCIGNLGYKHRLRMCNMYFFSTAAMVARTRLNVALYVRCLSCISCVMHHVWLPNTKSQNFSKCITISFHIDLNTSRLKIIQIYTISKVPWKIFFTQHNYYTI